MHKRPIKRNARPSGAPSIFVIAGTNGAGKSSVAGEMFLEHGVESFNPDEAAKRLRSVNLSLSIEASSAAAWQTGVRLLRRAIDQRLRFAFETTLGGHTITALLESAALSGVRIRIWYVGLLSPELHIQRVRARVARGGHDIPEEKIRERYDQSRSNLLRLLPLLSELRLYDNSDEGARTIPDPKLILHLADGKLVRRINLDKAPGWTKPIFMEALRLDRANRA